MAVSDGVEENFKVTTYLKKRSDLEGGKAALRTVAHPPWPPALQLY